MGLRFDFAREISVGILSFSDSLNMLSRKAGRVRYVIILDYMIDIHSHILPSVDDGSRSVEESIEMARQEVSGGTAVIFSTPHVYTNADFQKADTFVEKVVELQKAFDSEGVPLKVIQGAEVFPMMEIMEAINAGHAISLGGHRKHVLIDLPLGPWPLTLDSLTFDLLSNGVTPIFAHPERTAPVHQSLDILIPFLERGVLMQVNAGSLYGRYGPLASQRGQEILSRGWAQFLASDMHRVSKGGSMMQQAKAKLPNISKSYLEELTVTNPGFVLAGKSVPATDTDLLRIEPEKKTFFGRLFAKRA